MNNSNMYDFNQTKSISNSIMNSQNFNQTKSIINDSIINTQENNNTNENTDDNDNNTKFKNISLKQAPEKLFTGVENFGSLLGDNPNKSYDKTNDNLNEKELRMKEYKEMILKEKKKKRIIEQNELLIEENKVIITRAYYILFLLLIYIILEYIRNKH